MAISPKVLVCEDEPISLMALELLLAEEGFAVSRAMDGEAAASAVRDMEFDLILTDLQMPKLAGRQLIQAMRQARPDIPIIVMTGLPPADGEAALNGHSGTLLLFKKPLDFNALLREAHRLVGADEAE